MFDSILASLLLGDSFKEKIRVHPGFCLRSTKEKDQCLACVEACPAEAIFALDDGVELEPIICTGCNLCVSLCYSRNFTSEKFPYLKLSHSIFENNQTIISCMKNPKGQPNFGCIRTMDKSFLSAFIASGLDHKIILDLSLCQDCEYVDLDDLSFIGQLSLAYDKEPSKIEISSQKRQRSRRDFLLDLAASAKDLGSQGLDEFNQVLEVLGLSQEKLENIDFLVHVFIKSALDKKTNLQPIKEWVYQPLIGEKCSMCLGCIHSCPSSALSHKRSRDYETIVIDPHKCNYCGRCIEKCPQGAICKGVLENLECKEIFRKNLAKCKACLIKSTEIDQEGYCKTCSKRKNIKYRMKLY